MEKIRKNIGLLLAFAFTVAFAQEEENIPAEKMTSDVSEVKKDTTVTKRMKLDGIAAVIGDYVILDSDIEKTLVDLRNQGASTEDVTHCQLLGKLMEDRLYAHQAVQDSLLVSDDQVNATSDRQIQQLVQQVGSMEKVLKFYKKPDIESFRAELFEINKLRILSEKMQTEITKDIEVTPEEVRQFFYKIPEEERPIFGAELEIAQIVKQPKAPEEEVQKIIDRLKRIKQDVEENGSSFRIKAVLNTKDEPSRANGGFYTVTRSTPFVKEFKDVAFSLREGEISDPFETQYGYHIILVEKIRGREVDLRHILMIPEIPDSAMKEAAKELDEIRDQLLEGKYTFAEAAQNFSDEKETRNDGGVLRNPIDFGSRFELTKMDPALYNQVRDLKDNEISRPLREDDPRGGAPKFKIMKITNRYDEHKADFAKDYLKIQELALREKQYKAIKEWMDEHIEDTYIHVDKDNRGCDFTNNWVKQ
jgi:peptidyl-prolyl cis-trans isomerase SurA